MSLLGKRTLFLVKWSFQSSHLLVLMARMNFISFEARSLGKRSVKKMRLLPGSVGTA